MEEYLAHGKRGEVFLDKEKNVVIKRKRDSATTDRLSLEARYLKVLNKHGIGPKLHSFENNELVMEYVDGPRILDWIPTAPEKEIRLILLHVLNQCRVLDMFGLNKMEMANPYKHILIKDNDAVMIDFERMRPTKKPKNVTQFVQFITSQKVEPLLKEKKIRIDKEKAMQKSKEYKEALSEDAYDNLMHALFPKGKALAK